MSANRKISTKKVWIALLSVVMIGGFIVLFVAASKDKKEGSCKGIVIALDKESGTVYVDTARIRKQLLAQKQLNPIGKSLAQLDIPLLEQAVDSNDWVKHAEVYLGNHDLLYINIEQRMPVARVFTKEGKSFYLDTSGERIPALGKFTIKLPVFTGFHKDNEDSTLLTQIKAVSRFIVKDTFWMAQIEQIAIDKDLGFEMIPQLGDALIVFGRGVDVADKFNKLMVFYKEGLNNVGWGYYDTLDLRFAGQVVASRKKEKGNPVITALVTHNDPEHLQDIRKQIAENKKSTQNNKALASAETN